MIVSGEHGSFKLEGQLREEAGPCPDKRPHICCFVFFLLLTTILFNKYFIQILILLAHQEFRIAMFKGLFIAHVSRNLWT